MKSFPSQALVGIFLLLALVVDKMSEEPNVIDYDASLYQISQVTVFQYNRAEVC